MVDTTTATPETPSEGQAKTPEITEEYLDKLVQSAEDRIRTEYSKKNKALLEEVAELKKAKMTSEQLKEYERKQLEDRLTQKEKELNDKEIAIKARDLLTAAGLDLTFVNFVKGGTVEETEKRVRDLKESFSKTIESTIEEKLRAAGRIPGKERAGAPAAGFAGMTPKEIQEKARKDPEWFRKNENDILQAYANGTLKK